MAGGGVKLSAQTGTGPGSDSRSNSTLYTIFDQELEKYTPGTNDLKNLKPLKSPLPAWLSSSLKTTPDTLFMIGISDPGLPDSLARNQALSRAFSLALLSHRCKGSFLSDYYIKSKHLNTDSKFEELYLFSAKSRFDPGICTVIRSTKLRSREVIVVVAIPLTVFRSMAGDSLFTDGYLYSYDMSAQTRKSLIRKMACRIHFTGETLTATNPDSLSFYHVNKRFTGIRNLFSKQIPERYRYDYFYSSINIPSSSASRSRMSSSSCKSGLWITFLDQLYEQLAFYMKSHSNQLQLVQDQTTGLRNELNREKMILDMTFTIGTLSIYENNLRVSIDIRHD